MDQNTLNLNQDPGFLSHLDPDPCPELYYQLQKKKFKIILEEISFFKTVPVFFSSQNFKNKPPKDSFIVS